MSYWVNDMETGVNARVSEILPRTEEAKAPHIGHSNHLCDMAEKGRVPLSQMKELVKDPQFICKKCGRVAHSADNLCEPIPLFDQAASAAPPAENPAAPTVEEIITGEVEEDHVAQIT